MKDIKDKKVLLLGLGGRGRAIGHLLLRAGARVCALDPHDTKALREETGELRKRQVSIHLGASRLPDEVFDLAVVSPAIPATSPLVEDAVRRGVSLIGELEFAYQMMRCLSIAVTGTNGKGTVAGLIEHVLVNGTVVYENKAHTGARTGKVLRRP